MELHATANVVSAVRPDRVSPLRRYVAALAVAGLILALACPAWAVNTDFRGGSQPHNNMQPYQPLTYVINMYGVFPPRNSPAPGGGTDDLVGGGEYMASIGIFAGSYAPRGWAKTEGQILPIAQNQSLFSLLGTTYGGDGRTDFALPDLRGRTPVHAGGSAGTNLTNRTLGQDFGQHQVALDATAIPSHSHTIGTAGQTLNAGGSQSHNNMQPSLALNYCIALQGLFPSRSTPAPDGASGDGDLGLDPFLGEVGLFAGNFAPRNWAYCNGQLLQVAQHSALFALLGTTYGGDGRNTFGLPDLRGRSAIGVGNGPGLSPQQWGQTQGVENVMLSVNQMRVHNHTVSAQPSLEPVGNAGGSQSHTNMQPTQSLNYIIALQGIFPPRNAPVPDGEASPGDEDASAATIGEIKMFAGNFAPRGWALCEGQLLLISQADALFSIVGTEYGGDGRTTFGLPDLRGRIGIGEGQGPGLPDYLRRIRGGAQTASLNTNTLGSHNHVTPEPTSATVLLLALAGAAIRRRRRRIGA